MMKSGCYITFITITVKNDANCSSLLNGYLGWFHEVAPVLLNLLYMLLFSLMTFLTLALMNSVGPQVFVMLDIFHFVHDFSAFFAIFLPSQHFTACPQKSLLLLNWEFLEFTLYPNPRANETNSVSHHQTGSCSRLDSALSNKQPAWHVLWLLAWGFVHVSTEP